MSTRYLVRASTVATYLRSNTSEIPQDLQNLIEQAETIGRGRKREPYLVIGTRFGNGDSACLISNYSNNPSFYQSQGISETDARQIEQSRKPFYSKWDRDSPLLLHDKPTRFLWHTVGRDFWEVLPRTIKVTNLNNDLLINTLGDIFDALRGPNSTMEDVEGMRQGIYKEDPPSFPSWWLR